MSCLYTSSYRKGEKKHASVRDLLLVSDHSAMCSRCPECGGRAMRFFEPRLSVPSSVLSALQQAQRCKQMIPGRGPQTKFLCKLCCAIFVVQALCYLCCASVVDQSLLCAFDVQSLGCHVVQSLGCTLWVAIFVAQSLPAISLVQSCGCNLCCAIVGVKSLECRGRQAGRQAIVCIYATSWDGSRLEHLCRMVRG